MRNLYIGIRDGQDYGNLLRFGWLVDNFGYCSQTPQIHTLFGIDEVFVWRGPVFAGDRIKLRQAIRNLVANAIEHTPREGVIQVGVRRHGTDVRIEVIDSGRGGISLLAARNNPTQPPSAGISSSAAFGTSSAATGHVKGRKARRSTATAPSIEARSTAMSRAL